MREVRLVPMSEGQFASYEHDSVLRYAEENIKAGYRTKGDAVQKAKEDHLRLLPSGLATPNNFLLVIQDAPSGQPVGELWFRIEDGERRIAFIYDLFLKKEFRGKGYGKAAIRALEDLARSKGIEALYLHVFAHNPVAVHLYEGSGFKVKSMNMEKRLD